jgi:Ca2+-binding RTX toxin-like protein
LEDHGSQVSRIGALRICLLSLLSVLAMLAVPDFASAAASRVAAGDGFPTLDWTALGDTTPHTLVISYTGGAYSVTDTAGITAGTGCTQVTSTSASCSATNVTSAVTADGSSAGDKLTVASLGPEIDPSQSLHQVGVFGNGGNDDITTPASADLIRGGDGDDLIDGGLGPDNINGQRGVDTVTYASRPASQPVYVNMQQNFDGIAPPSGSSGGSEGDSPEVENVIGTPGNDTIIGFNSRGDIYDNSAANAFTGGGGNDLLVGLEGADRLLGGPGNDRLLGGAQKDKLVGGGGRDRCVGGPSKDRAKGCERKGSI